MITLVKTWGNWQQPWGFEVRAIFTDGSREYNEELVFRAAPTAPELAARCAAAAERLDRMLNPPVVTTITNADGSTTEIRGTGDPVAVDLRVTLTTAQRNAWELIRPLLKTYLQRIMRILRELPPDKVAELRARNVVLDRVLDMLGE